MAYRIIPDSVLEMVAAGGGKKAAVTLTRKISSSGRTG
jgi:hypothetical protein